MSLNCRDLGAKGETAAARLAAAGMVLRPLVTGTAKPAIHDRYLSRTDGVVLRPSTKASVFNLTLAARQALRA